MRDEALSNTAHLVDIGDGRAVVVDPRRDIDEYVALADRRGARIVSSFETHLHADYVSGSRELARASAAEVVMPRAADADYADRILEDGDRVEFDGVVLRALATPGHTPEHLAYVLEENGRPRAVFTGGSLIVGGAARTDLLGPQRTDALASDQFRSLRLLAELPDDIAVYPTHGAGSFCLAAASPVTNPTIGSEKRTNPLLQVDDENEFVRQLTAGFGTFPRYYRHLQDVNQRGASLLSELTEPVPLDPDQIAAAVERGAWLVDARPTDEWSGAHPMGAVSIELRPAFASWLGWVVPFGAPIILLVGDQRRDAAVTLANRIGYDVAGWLDGGVDAWARADLPIASVEEVAPADAARRHAHGAVLLDVRQQAELEVLTLPGATHVALGAIAEGHVPAFPRAADVITFCGHGERSATAASLLQRQGVTVANLAGGAGAWEVAGLPTRR
ncbi:MAG: MBL fold metallo-hydrolase [Acidimicrobiia bacterium]